MVIALIGTAFTVGIFASFSALTAVEFLYFGIVMYCVYIFHLFSAAESDIMNPQYEQYATFSEQSNNPNETGSAILGVLISAIVFIVALLLSAKSNDGVWLKLALVSVALAALKVFTYLSKIKAFYKEKQ